MVVVVGWLLFVCQQVWCNSIIIVSKRTTSSLKRFASTLCAAASCHSGVLRFVPLNRSCFSPFMSKTSKIFRQLSSEFSAQCGAVRSGAERGAKGRYMGGATTIDTHSYSYQRERRLLYFIKHLP